MIDAAVEKLENYLQPAWRALDA